MLAILKVLTPLSHVRYRSLLKQWQRKAVRSTFGSMAVNLSLVPRLTEIFGLRQRPT